MSSEKKLDFTSFRHSQKMCLVSRPGQYMLLQRLRLIRSNGKELRQKLIVRLPTNIQLVQISPMTKSMGLIFTSILVIAEYLGIFTAQSRSHLLTNRSFEMSLMFASNILPQQSLNGSQLYKPSEVNSKLIILTSIKILICIIHQQSSQIPSRNPMTSKQQETKRKDFSKSLKKDIRKRPHTEVINGKDYTYGLLEKKSESSLFSNERLIIIKGIETFGYASSLPDNVLIPFQSEENIPKFKAELPLEAIDTNNDKQILKIDFQDKDNKKVIWEFKCGSKPKSVEWRQKIEAAKTEKLNNMKDLSQKVILEDPDEHNEESETNPKPMTKEYDLEDDTTKKAGEKPLDKMIQEKGEKKQQSADVVEQKKQEELKQNENRNANNQPLNNIFDNLLGVSSAEKKNEQEEQKVSQEQHDATKNLAALLQGSQKPESDIDDDAQRQFEGSNIAKSLLPNAKEQFKRKKQQSSNDDAGNQNGLLSILQTVSDSKFTLQKMKRDWGFEFAKGEEEHNIIEDFRVYVETIMAKIVDELSFQPQKRYFKPIDENSESLKFEIEGVSLQIFINQLADVSTVGDNYSMNQASDKSLIIANEPLKRAYQELKNLDYILQLTNNRGRIRVPLAMCVQYKGFVALAKAIVPEAESYDNLEALQKELQLLQVESRISNSVFEDSENGRIVPLQNKLYEKLSRAENNPRQFDLCFVEGLRNYLPQDFYRFGKNSSSAILRKELVQDEQYEDVTLYGQNMSNVVNRLKIPQYLKEGVEVLTEISKTISDRVNSLITAVENLDETITNSKDISSLMHGYGVNMRYLGLVFERVNEPWLKSIIMSEIAARCAKYFLRFDLQDSILNLSESKPETVRKFQVKQVISFLNKMLGNSEQTQAFWDQLSRQSQTYFHCYIEKSVINTGFLVQALQRHCRIKLTKLSEQIEYFKSSSPLAVQNFASFEIKSKTYDLGFCELYRRVNSLLKQLTQESYQQLSTLLNISRKGTLANHFNLNGFAEKIILFMVNWLSPHEGHSIYYPEEIKLGEILPYKSLYQIKLTEIKWLLKDRKEDQSEKVRDWILDHIHRWVGEYHPILTELYDLYSRYYLSDKHMEKKSVNYCKSAIKNQEKLLGSKHVKLADNYYMLATIYMSYDRKIEALNSLRRAKDILEEEEQSEAFGMISLKMGQLLLASNSLQDALQCGIEAYSLLSDAESIESFVECVELISRCYEVGEDWEEFTRFSQEISAQLGLVSDDSDLLERMVKVVMTPYFHQLAANAQVSRKVLNLLDSFPRTTYSTNMAYEYVKSKVEAKSFPSELIDQLESIEELVTEIQNNGIMTRWKGFENVLINKNLLNKLGTAMNVKGFELLANLEALNIFLGEGYLHGVFLLL